MNKLSLTALLTLVSLSASAAPPKKLDVIVIDRKDVTSEYNYVVPGKISSNGDASVNCTSIGTSTNCTASGENHKEFSPGMIGNYQLTGSTLTLQLPDGRLTIVNCDSKINFTEWTGQRYRSCRIPMVANITADFRGDKAKLSWPVSIDGSKMATETYKIIAVLDAPPPDAEQLK